MWKLFFVILVSAQSGHAIALNRSQLIVWINNYLSENYFDLNSRQITSISTGTFTGLSQIQYLYLSSNQLTSLDASIFNGLFRIQVLTLNNNQFASLDKSIFKGLSQL